MYLTGRGVFLDAPPCKRHSLYICDVYYREVCVCVCACVCVSLDTRVAASGPSGHASHSRGEEVVVVSASFRTATQLAAQTLTLPNTARCSL